jgi:hypothetical protein
MPLSQTVKEKLMLAMSAYVLSTVAQGYFRQLNTFPNYCRSLEIDRDKLILLFGRLSIGVISLVYEQTKNF